MALKRQLSLIDLTLMGVGMILGAGIYVLVGSAGVQAGTSLWIAFGMAGIIALFTGLSYAELASMYPEAGSSFQYIKRAFKNDTLAFASGWLFIASTIIAAAAVALGFANYANTLGISPSLTISALAVIAIAVLLNVRGLGILSKVMDSSTLLEISGLLIVIAIGFTMAKPTLAFTMPHGTGGLLNATALAFFAFIGFEVIANQAGEARNPRRDVPLALILAILISIALYALTAIAFTSLASYDQIVQFDKQHVGALASAASSAAGPIVLLVLSIIALFSTGNTVLMSLTTSSRMIYGMAHERALPKILLRTHNGTPLIALVFAALIAAILTFAGSLDVVANATVLGMLTVFALDNAALLTLRKSQPLARRPFMLPFAIGKYPITAILGVLTCALLFTYSAITQPVSLAILVMLILAGIALKVILKATSTY